MYQEYLLLFQREVERREAWIEKNESKLTSSLVGDAKDLPDFLKQKDDHDVSDSVLVNIAFLIPFPHSRDCVNPRPLVSGLYSSFRAILAQLNSLHFLNTMLYHMSQLHYITLHYIIVFSIVIIVYFHTV